MQQDEKTKEDQMISSNNYPKLEDLFQLSEELLGKGSFGSVYKGESKTKPIKTVAIKLVKLRKEQLMKIIDIDRFQREAKFLKELSHPNILEFVNACYHRKADANGSTSLVLCLVTDYCEYNLHMLFKTSLEITMPYMKTIMLSLFGALEYIHAKNIIHRDVKAENILLTADGVLKLADFGTAIYTNLVPTNRIGGTLAFMPPEMIFPESIPKYSDRADIWSAGMVLYGLWKKNYVFNPPAANLDLAIEYFRMRGQDEAVKRSHETKQENDFIRRIKDLMGNTPITDLLTKLLHLNDALRPSATQVLALPLFKESPDPMPLSFLLAASRHELKEVRDTYIHENTNEHPSQTRDLQFGLGTEDYIE